MSFHFAYPNVLPRKGLFIGCGRYTAFATGKAVAAEYCEVQGAPVTPNKSNLKRAVQLLAAESYDSVKLLYHKQDRPEEKYQGDSLDLAWFLAHILRARKLCSKIQTDAWCTGVIQVDGSGPHLLDVDPDGFLLKLQAFLDGANDDLLFIVPLANLDPQARKICKEHKTKIIRLGGDASCSLACLSGKTVLAVPADGLPNLLEFLFLTPDSSKPKGGNTRLYLLFLLLICVAGFAGIAGLQEQSLLPAGSPVENTPPVSAPINITPPPVPEEQAGRQFTFKDIIREFEQGNFLSIPDFLKADFSQKNQELHNLRLQITTPVLIQGEMEYLLANGTRGKVSFDPNENPPTLSHHDYYRLRIQASTPPGLLYLYLFQMDSGGSLTQIFPSEQFGTKNPVSPWQWPIILPAKEDKWIFLDELNIAGLRQSKEIIYLLASPWPARDIEALIRRLQDTQDNEDDKARILFRFSLRRQAGVDSISCICWSFFHGR